MTTLAQLVFGADRPDQILLSSGALPEGWLIRYEEALQTAIATSPPDLWHRSLAQAAHWVSVYLPIRLDAASQFGHPNPDTLETLRRLSRFTEMCLFDDLRRGLGQPVVAALSGGEGESNPEAQLVQLSLGQGNPANYTATGATLDQWRHSFVAAWSAVAVTLKSQDEWPKWPFMAAHFASFYWDLWFKQIIPLEQRSDCLFEELSFLPTPVQIMVETMLGHTSRSLDSSGLPMIGKASGKAYLSVRRLVESVLADTAQSAQHPADSASSTPCG